MFTRFDESQTRLTVASFEEEEEEEAEKNRQTWKT